MKQEPKKKQKKIRPTKQKNTMNKQNLNKNKSRKIKDSLFLLITITGLLCLLYPFYTDYKLNQSQKAEIRSYRVENKKKSTAEIADIEKNNKELNEQSSSVEDPFATSKFDLKESKLPDVFGILTIPKINLEVPVYPTTSNLVLEKGIGILEGTSLPTGGEGNHSVLTGHRGLSLGKMFTDLPKLKLGDKFYIEVLDKTLAYEVDQIETIKPDDLSHFDKEEGKDTVILVTCTPLGINSHRLLVRGQRIPYDSKEKNAEKGYFWTLQHILMVVLLGLFLLVASFIIWRNVKKKKVRKRKNKKKLKKKKQKIVE